MLNGNTQQAAALKRIPGDALEAIALYAEEWREIINDFEKEGRELSAADLLWIASEHHGKDITKG